MITRQKAEVWAQRGERVWLIALALSIAIRFLVEAASVVPWAVVLLPLWGLPALLIGLVVLGYLLRPWIR
jgi:hypothetical protein